MLQHAAVAGASALIARTSAAAAAPSEIAQGIPPFLPLPRTADPCTLRYSPAGRGLTFSAQGTYQGKRLVLQGAQTASGRPLRSATYHVEVTLAGQSVFALQHRALPARDASGRRVLALKGEISYGPAVRGIRQVLFLQSGGAVTGYVDGRPFSTDVRTPSALRFADRRPAPAATIDPGLAAAVRTLFQTAGRNIQTCRSLRAAGPAAPARRAAFPSRDGAPTRRALLAHSVSPVAAPVLVAQGTQNACDDCANSCMKKLGGCLAAAYAACAGGAVFTFGASCLGIGFCYDDAQSCGDDCNKPGGPCCNRGCSDGTCCAQEDSCCPGAPCCGPDAPVCIPGGFCCPADTPVGCAGVAPPAGAGGMSVGFHSCCVSGSTCCNGACCAADQYCANSTWSVCCPKGQQWCWTGGVVSTTNVITGVTSKTNVMACCEGVCLNDGQGNLLCCPQTQVCGGTCCPPGHHCMNANTGRSVCCDHGLCGGELCCGINDVCTETVDPRTGLTRYSCQAGTFGVPCGHTSCSIGTVCCNGVCCAPGQACVNGRCARPVCPRGQVPCPNNPGQCCPPHFICCGGSPSGQCCNPATQICCGGRGCLPSGYQCIQ